MYKHTLLNISAVFSKHRHQTHKMPSISFQTFFFVQAFKIVIDSWKFSMLLLYILWRWLTNFMISGSNEQLQQGYTLLKPDCHSWWILKTQSGCEDTLEEWYAIKFCFKLGKNATETYGMLQTTFWPSCMNQASVFEWHKRFKDGRESVRDDERCGRNKEVRTPELIGQIKNFMDKDCCVSIETICAQWELYTKLFVRNWRCGRFAQSLSQGCSENSILVTDYLTKMGIKTVPHPPYSLDLAPSDFWLFPKLKENLRGCCYESIEEMKEAVMKVIDTLIQEDHTALPKLLEWYNKCIAAGGDYFEGD